MTARTPGAAHIQGREAAGQGRLRKVNTRDFRRATRRTSRAVNQQIVLNLIREHQPISRADLARRMRVRRGVISVLVGDLLAHGAVYEGAPGATARGRRPAPLFVRTADRLAAAVDVRVDRTYVMLANFSGRPLALESLATPRDPGELIAAVADRVKRLVAANAPAGSCEGVGLVVPGAVDWRTGRVLHAPHLGWRELDVREALAERVGLPVHVESAPVACALAQLWFDRGVGDNFVYVTVSDGVGAGVVVNGEVVRGHGHTVGEFGHLPLDLAGPVCACGARGCWEAYVSNRAVLRRYTGGASRRDDDRPVHTPARVEDIVALARAGDPLARRALEETAYYVGLGLSVVVNALSPARVYVAGEIAGAWDLIEGRVREALAGRALTAAAAATPVIVAADAVPPRLRGAAALVAAPMFAAPRVG